MKGGNNAMYMGVGLLVVCCCCCLCFLSLGVGYEMMTCDPSDTKAIDDDDDGCYCGFMKSCDKDKYCTKKGKCQNSPGDS
tara:strand:- start:318 stop:557 length:240 start_codon:yes stop_codon:yes gene_type:complete